MDTEKGGPKGTAVFVGYVEDPITGFVYKKYEEQASPGLEDFRITPGVMSRNFRMLHGGIDPTKPDPSPYNQPDLPPPVSDGDLYDAEAVRLSGAKRMQRFASTEALVGGHIDPRAWGDKDGYMTTHDDHRDVPLPGIGLRPRVSVYPDADVRLRSQKAMSRSYGGHPSGFGMQVNRDSKVTLLNDVVLALQRAMAPTTPIPGVRMEVDMIERADADQSVRTLIHRLAGALIHANPAGTGMEDAVDLLLEDTTLMPTGAALRVIADAVLDPVRLESLQVEDVGLHEVALALGRRLVHILSIQSGATLGETHVDLEEDNTTFGRTGPLQGLEWIAHGVRLDTLSPEAIDAVYLALGRVGLSLIGSDFMFGGDAPSARSQMITQNPDDGSWRAIGERALMRIDRVIADIPDIASQRALTKMLAYRNDPMFAGRVGQALVEAAGLYDRGGRSEVGITLNPHGTPLVTGALANRKFIPDGGIVPSRGIRADLSDDHVTRNREVKRSLESFVMDRGLSEVKLDHGHVGSRVVHSLPPPCAVTQLPQFRAPNRSATIIDQDWITTT